MANFNNPTHDPDAEAALLANLLSPQGRENIDAIMDLLEPDNFFDPRNAEIYATLTKLHMSGKVFGPIEVLSVVRNEGRERQAGGPEYFFDLANPSSLASYGVDPISSAAVIKDYSRRRKLMEISDRIREIAQPGSGFTGAEAAVFAETEMRNLINEEKNAGGTSTLVDLYDPTIQEIKDAENMPPGLVGGVPSGFLKLDDMISGFRPNTLSFIAARPGVGKALALDTVLLSQNGKTTIGALKAGDRIFGPDGQLRDVVKVHEVYTDLPSYRVYFSDGSSTVVNDEHLWYTETHSARKSRHAASKSPKDTERDTKLPAEKIAKVQAAYDAAGHDDLITLSELGKLVGLPFPSKPMIAIAEHLLSHGFKTTRLTDRTVGTVDAKALTKHMLEDASLAKIHSDNVILDKVANLVHTSPNQRMAAFEVAQALFGRDDANATHYLAKVIAESKLPQVKEKRTVEYNLRYPMPLYNTRELLGAYLEHAQSFRNDQRHKNVVGSVKTTREIMDTLTVRDKGSRYGRWNHSIPVAKPLQLPERALPVDPYSVGVALGRGNLKALEEDYLLASQAQRQALLEGLLSTRDAIADAATIQLVLGNEASARSVFRLVAGLGYIPRLNEDEFGWHVVFTTVEERNAHRYIVGVEQVASVPMRCITVDAPDHLFLVGDALIATHNSTIAVDFARNAVFNAGKTVMFFSLEMGKDELMKRIMSAEANVSLQKIKRGNLMPEEWAAVREVRERINHGSFIIDDNPNLSLARLRSSCTRQMARPEGLDMVIIDYLQLMEVPKGYAARQEQVSELSRGLKLLSKELGLPVIVLAQLNRKSEERADRKPQISDLRESGSLEQDADIILLIHRPDQFNPEVTEGGTDLIVGKNRGGPGGAVALTSMLEFCKFVPAEGQFPRTDMDENGNETIQQYESISAIAEEPSEQDLSELPW
jgi:replicative DNA helicase